MWWLSALGGAVALLTRLLAPADAGAVIERIAPVLVFLVAVTVIAGQGTFRTAAHGLG